MLQLKRLGGVSGQGVFAAPYLHGQGFSQDADIILRFPSLSPWTDFAIA